MIYLKVIDEHGFEKYYYFHTLDAAVRYLFDFHVVDFVLSDIMFEDVPSSIYAYLHGYVS